MDTIESTETLRERAPIRADQPAPKDRFGFVSLTIFLFGIGSLLPWNFFITATDYWNYKFRNVTVGPNEDSSTELQKSFNSYLAIASKLPYIIFLVVNILISDKIRCALRVGYSLFGCFALFLVTTALVLVDTDKHQIEFLAATLCIVVLINVVCAFLQGGGTGLAGVLPTKYMATNVMGQAAGGVFACLCQVGCFLVGASPIKSALLYFGIASFMLLLTTICFLVLVKTDFYAHYMGDDEIPKAKSRAPYWDIFKAGWKFYVTIVLIFWVTLAVFPAITANIRSSHKDNGSKLTNELFVPLACFVVFNFADLGGRLVAKFLPIPARYASTILGLTIARILFIPLFLVCNVSPTKRHLTSVLLPEDWQYILIMISFGTSNGYLTSLAFTHGPKTSPEKYHEVAGSLAALFLGLGLALGSVSSYGTLKLL